MDATPVDSTAVVASTPLPYQVPLDLVMRGFRLIAIFGSIYFVVSRFFAPRSTPIEWAIAAAAAFFAIRLQLAFSRLVIRHEGIEYSRVFSPKQSLSWSTIRSVRTGTGDVNFHGIPIKGSLKGNARGGAYLMVLERNDSGPSVMINIKPFSMDGLKILAHFVICKASHAEIDDATRKLTQGIVPSVFFGQQKGYG